MLFYTFPSQETRKNFGGSALIEIQFCKRPSETKIKELVAASNIDHWWDDSLYVRDEDLFYREYSHILQCGIYSNLKCGIVDIYGINYYAPSSLDSIIKTIYKEKPADHNAFIPWLIRSKQYNGFYILGL